MGGETSSEAEQTPPPEHDFFLLESLSKMQLTHPRVVAYYLILPQYPPPHLMHTLSQQARVEYFPEVRTLKQEMAFIRPNELVKVIAAEGLSPIDMQYLQNEPKIYQIILYGTAEFPVPKRKIAGAVIDLSQLVNVLRDLSEKDVLQIPSSTILLVDEDTKLLNKYRLNFHCATRYASRHQAKQDFLALARHLFPQNQPQIDQFAEDYDLTLYGQERARMTLQWAFRGGFFWKMVDQVTRNTTDPKHIAYVRLALRDLHEAINFQWRQRPFFNFVYVVVDLTEEQRNKLAKSDGRFMLFTSFVKGYTNQNIANAQLKARPHAFKFTIASNRGKLEPSLDFGLAVIQSAQGPNVLLNIYNVFQVMWIRSKNRDGELLSGALASNFLRRQFDRKNMSSKELDLVRNYDYLEDTMGKIDGQATLLQLSGYLKDSLQLYDRKAQVLRASNSTQAAAKCAILKADALRRSGEFEAAEKQYRSVEFQKMRLVSLVHLAELYLHRGEEGEEKFDKVIRQLAAGMPGLRGEREQYFKARNLLIIRMIKQGKYAEAISALNQLIAEVTSASPHSIEGKPVIHDIYRCLATCLSKQGDHTGAIHILKDTLGWQLACEGKTPNVALTETLIQSVSKSSNSHHQDLQRSMERAKEMEEQVSQSEANGIELTVGNDLIRSFSGIVAKQPLEQKKPQAIDQSIVRVDLNDSLIKAKTS